MPSEYETHEERVISMRMRSTDVMLEARVIDGKITSISIEKINLVNRAHHPIKQLDWLIEALINFNTMLKRLYDAGGSGE